MIDVWVNNGSGWIIELIEYQYINISPYRPLLGSSYMDLPIELRSPRKRLINIKNKDKKCFLWCHVRHINLSNKHPERIKKMTKKLLKNLIMMELSFLYKEKILIRLKLEKIYVLMYLVMRIDWFFQFIFQSKNLKIQWIYYF